MYRSYVLCVYYVVCTRTRYVGGYRNTFDTQTLYSMYFREFCNTSSTLPDTLVSYVRLAVPYNRVFRKTVKVEISVNFREQTRIIL